MTNEYDFLKKQRYEYYKGTTEIMDNEVNELVEDVVDVLNQKAYNINELLKIKQFQAQRIAELEEQLKNEIVLPKELQVGNKVYLIDVEEKYIHKGKIYSITKELNYEENGFITWVYCRYNDGLTYTHPIEDYGVELFATKEEAEERLKNYEKL